MSAVMTHGEVAGYTHIRVRIAEIGARQVEIAQLMGIDAAVLSSYLNSRRAAPRDFEQRITAVLDRIEAADEARAKVLAESHQP